MPEPRACWEEQPTEEEMVQVDLLLKETAGLSVQGLTGTVVALSFSKRLAQPIRDPTRGQNRNVPQEEAANRVARMM